MSKRRTPKLRTRGAGGGGGYFCRSVQNMRNKKWRPRNAVSWKLAIIFGILSGHSLYVREKPFKQGIEKPHTAIPAFIYGLSFLLQIFRARISYCVHIVFSQSVKKFAAAPAPLFVMLFIKGTWQGDGFSNCCYTSFMRRSLIQFYRNLQSLYHTVCKLYSRNL